MSTIVLFHAHPDDEAIATGGTIMRAVAEGHRVVLVVATGGELGLPVEGVAAQGSELAALRRREVEAAAAILGIHRVVHLGYPDSGMAGDPSNDDPSCFCQTDVEAAARVVAGLLTEESAEVLTVYDENGGYGHPDHIQVHRVGVRAAELAGVARVFESTINRTAIERLMAAARAAGAEVPEEVQEPDEADPQQFGMPEEAITHRVEVSAHIDAKKAAMVAHASQIGPDSWFLQMPDEAFAGAFGEEWFIRHGVTRDPDAAFVEDLFTDLPG